MCPGSHFHESSLHQDLNNEYRYWRNKYTCFPVVRLLSIICFLAIFCSSRGRISFITILRWFILFLRSSAIQKIPSAIFSEPSVSRLFMPQLITTYSSDCGKGMLSALHNMFWILSPPIPLYCIFIAEFIPDVGGSEKSCNNGVSKQNSRCAFWRFNECCLVFMMKEPIILAEMTSRVGNPQTEVIISW